MSKLNLMIKLTTSFSLFKRLCYLTQTPQHTKTPNNSQTLKRNLTCINKYKTSFEHLDSKFPSKFLCFVRLHRQQYPTAGQPPLCSTSL